MRETVLDASAILALLHQEPGAEVVLPLLTRSHLSAVNLAEVLTKLVDIGVPTEVGHDLVTRLGVTIEGFDATQAERAAALRGATSSQGLSLGDRACISLAQELGVPAVTADRAWTQCAAGVELVLIR